MRREPPTNDLARRVLVVRLVEWQSGFQTDLVVNREAGLRK